MVVIKASLNSDEVWEILNEVKDPEIPVISVVEMGIIFDVKIEGGRVQVVLAPTFTGCPALHVMRDEIVKRLREAGAEEVSVNIENRAWSTDRISLEGREKLRAFGLAPPLTHHGQIERALDEPAICPHCGSKNTSLKNPFGPTLCRAIYVCNNCSEPFEQFKPL